jgi:CheY-like chemotaxis protein
MPQPMPLEPLYLIYVDDDPDDIEIFKGYFSHLDHLGIATFSNGNDLIEYLSVIAPADYPCIIVLDINMPKMGGWEIVTVLKRNENWQHIPLIMFSTSTNMQETKKAMYGVDVVTKPVSLHEAKGVAEKLLRYCSKTTFSERSGD